ncbi:hypothetical protein [Neisseria sp.]|uniref:hypothetical protein n=1 Tax=Neisseria sp. TaxID=192066 RepID=UPI00359F4D29
MKSGIFFVKQLLTEYRNWIPACAGMTEVGEIRLACVLNAIPEHGLVTQSLVNIETVCPPVRITEVSIAATPPVRQTVFRRPAMPGLTTDAV